MTVLDNLINSLKDYQNHILNLLSSIPKDKRDELIDSVPSALSIGGMEIISCNDGYIVFIFNQLDQVYFINNKGQVDKTMTEVFDSRSEEIFTFYDPVTLSKRIGNTLKFGPQPENLFINNVFSILIEDRNGSRMLPRFSKILLVGKQFFEEGSFSPKELADKDFQSALSKKNLKSKDRAIAIITEFVSLLDSAEREEDIQQFLNNHPYIIQPNYESVIIKPKISNKYIADYAFAIRKHGTLDWTFVEIEASSKSIFTTQNLFRAEFTQAKGQLLEWDDYISQNIKLLQDDFPNLHKPNYSLIFGRNSEIDDYRRGLLKSEFGNSNNRNFSTYDDLIENFKALVERLNR